MHEGLLRLGLNYSPDEVHVLLSALDINSNNSLSRSRRCDTVAPAARPHNPSPQPAQGTLTLCTLYPAPPGRGGFFVRRRL
jgi:hypothetical protein